MPVLQSTESSMQRHGAWRAMYKLQTGRGGLHRLGKPKEEVSIQLHPSIRRPLPKLPLSAQLDGIHSSVVMPGHARACEGVFLRSFLRLALAS
jgi:hypothetical protein